MYSDIRAEKSAKQEQKFQKAISNAKEGMSHGSAEDLITFMTTTDPSIREDFFKRHFIDKVHAPANLLAHMNFVKLPDETYMGATVTSYDEYSATISKTNGTTTKLFFGNGFIVSITDGSWSAQEAPGQKEFIENLRKDSQK